MNLQPQMHPTERSSLNLPAQVAKNPLEDPFLPFISPPLLLSFSLNIASFHSVISTHTPRPPGGGRGVTELLMHDHGDEPLVQSLAHKHTQLPSFCKEEHPAAVFMVPLCGGCCSKQQAYRSWQGLRVFTTTTKKNKDQLKTVIT